MKRGPEGLLTVKITPNRENLPQIKVIYTQIKVIHPRIWASTLKMVTFVDLNHSL